MISIKIQKNCWKLLRSILPAGGSYLHSTRCINAHIAQLAYSPLLRLDGPENALQDALCSLVALHQTLHQCLQVAEVLLLGFQHVLHTVRWELIRLVKLGLRVSDLLLRDTSIAWKREEEWLSERENNGLATRRQEIEINYQYCSNICWSLKWIPYFSETCRATNSNLSPRAIIDQPLPL